MVNEHKLFCISCGRVWNKNMLMCRCGGELQDVNVPRKLKMSQEVESIDSDEEVDDG
jgi:rRNA maturation endonuclease Nob1